MSTTERRRRLALAALGALVAVAACAPDMSDQPRYRPLGASDFFEDGRASRPHVEGTVARGELRVDEHLYTGQVDGEPAATFPIPVDAELLARGRERYDIYCAPCHDRVGTGRGMIVQRGFPAPPSLHQTRLREAAPGYLVDVITRGFGAMPDYAHMIRPRDRWAIAAYVQALQLSQWAPLDAVPAATRVELSAQADEVTR